MDTLHDTATAHPALGQIALLIAASVAVRLKASPGKNWQPIAIGAVLVAVLAALLRF